MPQFVLDLVPLATNATVIAMAVLLVTYGAHLIAQHFKWNDERWMGIVHSAIITVNATGVKFGPAWLITAEDVFEAEYAKTHGAPPSAEDLKDGVLDMARAIGPQALAIIGKDIASAITSNAPK
jgi:hypothetical protein